MIGRKEEIRVLNKRYQSEKSEFVALYGRTRVGKTFLIPTVFEQKITFQLTGLANATLSQQLFNFHLTIKDYKSEIYIGIPVS